ncbi:MAG: hypothetical protein PWR06_481 [Thermoanaerobacteraceae bacterium]|uniref:Uncharacterized protein n=1 Tax=Biomaibacter acetigenes TaxID=2316383 RepID=A0A3G2R6D8_9FIRM|nr:hypothetical protein [Biomaibacter acetigenes]AYO30966.1 hypothetical protein D2962_10425 [Biomaibacter acetigenes]MDK2877765.1 hypothetical protein [Thermoanaerobacteraceae bacterium]RKL61280.1 hypothetical protein DXT63_17600 [Thermoanaerobacteraceae bacterium SP2]
MKILTLGEDDMQLLKAIKPFMSSKGQGIIDTFTMVMNIFKPQDPQQKINYDALTEFLTIMNESYESQKALKKVEKNSSEEQTASPKSHDVENLLNVLADKK